MMRAQVLRTTSFDSKTLIKSLNKTRNNTTHIKTDLRFLSQTSNLNGLQNHFVWQTQKRTHRDIPSVFYSGGGRGFNFRRCYSTDSKPTEDRTGSLTSPQTSPLPATPQQVANNEEANVEEDPDFFDNPAAWGLNRVADGIESTASLVSFGVGLGGDITKATIQGASQLVKEVLPQNKQESSSTLLSTLAQTSSTAASAGKVVLSTASTVTSAAQKVGSTIGTVTGEIIASSVSLEGATAIASTDSSTGKAWKRLTKVSFESYSEVFTTVEKVAEDLGETTKESVVGVVAHSLGQDSSEIVKNTFETGRSVYKAVYKVKTFVAPTPKTMLKVATESALKAGVSEVSKQIIQKNKKKEGEGD